MELLKAQNTVRVKDVRLRTVSTKRKEKKKLTSPQQRPQIFNREWPLLKLGMSSITLAEGSSICCGCMTARR
jgi:hypothetical protein